MNLRTLAARVIFQVMNQGKSLSAALADTLTRIKDQRDQALVQAMCYGVCRHYFYLQALLDELLEKPFKQKDEDILALLLVGLYQLVDMRIPEYAAVAETVAATNDFKKSWAKGLVNAVLRRYQREVSVLQQKIEADLSACYDHPAWMIDMLQQDWPDQWQAILTENNQHPPFSLRVNQRDGTRASYLSKLADAGIEAKEIVETESGIYLSEAMDVAVLPGFRQGEVSVQDGAAQLAVTLLELSPALRVLDACAAPGGKTAHILENYPNLAEVVAVEKDAERLQSIRENFQRLNLSATLLQSDVADSKTWWDGKPFDRILLDAPCSATGVIRRHPDIKLLRRPEDIQQLAAEQWHCLTGVWPLLKPGGLLLYATCSILQQENNALLERFLAMHPDAKEDKIQAAWGAACTVGRQILPGQHGMDGFYYARLRKIA